MILIDRLLLLTWRPFVVTEAHIEMKILYQEREQFCFLL